MIIEITLNNNKYKIVQDSFCFTPFKLGENKDPESKNFGQPTESSLGHFSQLPNALNKLVKEECANNNDTVSLDEYIDRVKALNDEIKEQLEFYGL